MKRFQSIGLDKITANPAKTTDSLPGFAASVVGRDYVFLSRGENAPRAVPRSTSYDDQLLLVWKPLDEHAVYYRVTAEGCLHVGSRWGGSTYVEDLVRNERGEYTHYYD